MEATAGEGSPPVNSLPDALLAQIFRLLESPADLAAAEAACRSWRRVGAPPATCATVSHARRAVHGGPESHFSVLELVPKSTPKHAKSATKYAERHEYAFFSVLWRSQGTNKCGLSELRVNALALAGCCSAPRVRPCAVRIFWINMPRDVYLYCRCTLGAT